MRLSVTIVLVCLCLWASAQVSSRMLFKEANGCACETYFDWYDPEPIGVLCVGNLVSDECEIEKYVIDWYWEDFESGIQFTTGTADTDPDVTYIHPFTGTGCIPVESGTWIPWVRYIIVDGVKYYARHRPWEDYCVAPSAEVQEIEVEAFTCDNGGTGTYSHSLTFINTLQNYEYATRSIRFNLDEGQLWFAISFTGYLVSDRLTVYYCTPSDQVGTLLEDVAIGSDLGSYNWTTTPKKYNSSISCKFVINLEDFTIVTGDYLRLEIQPSYVQPPNMNTNWNIQMKCGAVGSAFTCYEFTSDMQTIDTSTTIAMVWNGTECRYDLTFSMKEPLGSYSATNAYTYLPHSPLVTGRYLGLFYQEAIGTYLAKNSTGYIQYVLYPSGSCMNLSGTMTISKTGSQMVLDFTAEEDYLTYKSDYNEVTTHANWTNYDPDPLSRNHYKGFYLPVRVANSCGDAYTSYYYYIARDAVFTFDDVNYTITIDLCLPETNGYVNAECEFYTHDRIDGLLWDITNTYNTANFSRTTNVRTYATNTLVGFYVYLINSNDLSMSSGVALMNIMWVDDNVNDMCDWTAPWCETPYSGDATVLDMWKYRMLVKIYPVTTLDPTQDFEVYNSLLPDGCTDYTPPLIYKILSGYVLPDWDSGSTPYSTDDMVINAEKAWKSLQDNNYEEPTAESAWWTRISSQ